MKIEFQIQKAGHVRLEVFGTSGKLVRTLVDSDLTSGRHSVSWNSRACPVGLYVYRLSAVGLNVERKELILK